MPASQLRLDQLRMPASCAGGAAAAADAVMTDAPLQPSASSRELPHDEPRPTAADTDARTFTKTKVVQSRAADQVEANGKGLRRTCFSQLLAVLKLCGCSNPRVSRRRHACPALRQMAPACDLHELNNEAARISSSLFSYCPASALTCTMAFISAACSGATLCRRLAALGLPPARRRLALSLHV